MRLSPLQMERLVEMIFQSWKTHQVVEFKGGEKEAFASALNAVQSDYRKEEELEQEAWKMVENLEKTQESGSFQKGKLFAMVKKKLAQERKVIL